MSVVPKDKSFDSNQPRPSIDGVRFRRRASIQSPSEPDSFKSESKSFPENSSNENIFSVLSFWILFIASIILPFFFLPTKPILLSFNKSLLIYVTTTVSLIFLLAHLFKGGRIFISKWTLIAPALFIILTSLFSSFVGSSFSLSYFGYGFEVGSLSFIILFFTIFFLASFIFQNKERINKTIFIILIPFSILFFYYFIKIFTGWNFFSLETVLNLNADTFLGGWNELAVYSGAVLVFSMIFLGISKSSRSLKYLYLSCFVISLFLMIIVNFRLAWIIALSLSLIFLLFAFFKSSKNKLVDKEDSLKTSTVKNKYLFIIFFIISLIFILPTGDILKDRIYNFLEINHIEVKPSWQGTSNVFLGTLTKNTTNFLLGSGPNSFSYEWRLYKDESVNLTDYWNTNFNYGAGLIPTFFITSGVLGLLGWLAFITSYFFLGFKYIYKNLYDGLSTSLFLISLYFWFISIFYLPSQTLFIFTALFSGIFLASIFIKEHSFFSELSFFRSRWKASLLSLFFLVLIVVNFWGGFITYKKFIGALDFEKGAIAFYAGDLETAEDKVNKSLKSSENDVYRRFLSEIYLIKLEQYSTEVNNPNSEEIADFKKYFDLTIQNIEAAIVFNPRSFENQIQLGRIYEFLAELGVENAYQNAKNTYIRAQQLEPSNPFPDFLLSNMEFSLGSLDLAEQFIQSALSKKFNYGGALFLNSKIKFSQGEVEEAIDLAIQTVNLFPLEPYSYFYLGLLYYQSEDYKTSIEVFREAVKIEPKFANARYFLGLSFVKSGLEEEAILEFESLLEDYPENKEVLSILDKLKNKENVLEESFSDYEISNKIEEQVSLELPADNE